MFGLWLSALRYRGMLIVVSRFLPGTRMVAYIATGMLGYPWKRFALFMAMASVVWTPIIVGCSMAYLWRHDLRLIGCLQTLGNSWLDPNGHLGVVAS